MSIEIGDVIELPAMSGYGKSSIEIDDVIEWVNNDGQFFEAVYVIDKEQGIYNETVDVTEICNVYSLKKPERVKGFETTWHVDMIQASPAWHKIKEDKISATGGNALMVGELGRKEEYLIIVKSDKSGEFSKGCLTMLNDKADFKRGRGKKKGSINSESAEWGNLMEAKSRKLYEKNTGKDTYEVGFVECNDYNIGISPDGVVKNEKLLIEIKNYGTDKVNKIVETGKIPKDAYLQMQFQLLVSDYDAVDFVLTDFHNEAKYEYTCIRVERDEVLIQVMKDKLIKASKYIDNKAKEDEDGTLDWLLG